MPAWGPSPGLSADHFTVKDGRIYFNKPITIQLPDITPGIAHTTLEGAISVEGEDGSIHDSYYADSDGDGDGDANRRGLNNTYDETSGKFHRRPGYTPGGAQKGRIVEEATTSAYYVSVGKDYNATTFVDWIFHRYGDTAKHWIKIDESRDGNIAFGGGDNDDATSRLTAVHGDIEVSESVSGVIIKSPNGTRWRIKVADDGSLSTSSVS